MRISAKNNELELSKDKMLVRSDTGNGENIEYQGK
jgi:hypothetical protein